MKLEKLFTEYWAALISLLKKEIVRNEIKGRVIISVKVLRVNEVGAILEKIVISDEI